MESGQAIITVIEHAGLAFGDRNLIEYEGVRHDSGGEVETAGLDISENGLVAVAERPCGGGILATGTAFGPIHVTVEVHEGTPPVDLDPWDEVVEVSYRTNSGIVGVWQPFDARVPQGLPVLLADPGSWVRLRVHAEGRDNASEAIVPSTPTEHFLVQMWPTHAHQAETRHKLTDRFGGNLRISG